MKGGRPAKFLGVRSSDLRIRYISMSRHSRGFYARWRPTLKAWECQLSGYGMRPRRWFSKTQTLALSKLQLMPCLWDWSPRHVDDSVSWSGIPDLGYSVDGLTQLDLFRLNHAASLPSRSLGVGDTAPVRSKGGLKP